MILRWPAKVGFILNRYYVTGFEGKEHGAVLVYVSLIVYSVRSRSISCEGWC